MLSRNKWNKTTTVLANLYYRFLIFLIVVSIVLLSASILYINVNLDLLLALWFSWLIFGLLLGVIDYLLRRWYFTKL